MSKKARFIKCMDFSNSNIEIVQKLYLLDKPIPSPQGPVSYIVISAVRSEGLGLEETLVFSADYTGRITSWLELAGFRNTVNHGEALERIGYVLS